MNQDTLRCYIERICNQTAWSAWQPLEESWLGNRLPKRSGIYRIRLQGAEDLLYVGETGKKDQTLKSRVGALREVYSSEEMPYRSPHTVAPFLWALRKRTNIPLEISIIPLGPDKALQKKGKKHSKNVVVPIQQEAEMLTQDEAEVEESVRKGLEALIIALHRQQFQKSPAAQNGRMIVGWRASSSNTAALAVRGLRYRGYQTKELDESHIPGIPPIIPLAEAGNPGSLSWGGHTWSTWCHPALAQPPEDATGLYRLRRPNAARDESEEKQEEKQKELLYIGRGQIADRLKEYGRGNFECSWVQGPWLYHQQVELQVDLLASYLLSCLALPPAQYGMSKQDRLIRMGQPVSPERVWWSVILEPFWREMLPIAS